MKVKDTFLMRCRKMNKCPCKGCVAPKRKPGCHSICPEYIEYSEQEEMRKKAYKIAMAAEEYFLLKSADTRRKSIFIIRKRRR